MEYVITFTWDDEAGVWIATSNDIPGLVLESGSFDALLERTRFAIPELLSLNAFVAMGCVGNAPFIGGKRYGIKEPGNA